MKWHAFGPVSHARDLAIVSLMLLHGLRSAEVPALNRDDIPLSESQLLQREFLRRNGQSIFPLAN